jgi:O-antigen ligase
MQNINYKKEIFFQKISCLALYLSCFFILFSTAALNIFILFSVIFGFLNIIMMRDFSAFNLKIFQYSSILFFMLVISILYTNADPESIKNIFFKYIKLLYLPILYYIVNSKDIIRNCFRYFHVGATIILFLSFLKFFNLFEPEIISKYLNLEYAYKLKAGATLFQHTIIHGVIFSFFGVTTYLKGSNSNVKYYYLLSFLSFYNVLLINISRTGYIISLCLIGLIIIREISRTKFKLELIALFLTIITLFLVNSNTVKDRFYLAYQDINLIEENYYNTSLGYRFLWLKNGINNLQEKPLLGHGIGSHKNTIQKYIKDNNIQHPDLHAIGDNPHNEFINISTQLGTVGLFAFIIFLIRLYKETSNNFLIKSIFIIIIISSLFNSLLYDNVLGLFAVILIILGIRNKQFNYLI